MLQKQDLLRQSLVLSHCVHIFEKILPLSGLYPLICCECRIIYKAKIIDNESRFHCSKKPLFDRKKNSCSWVHLKKNSCTSSERKKKNSCKLKIPRPPPPDHFSNGPSLNTVIQQNEHYFKLLFHFSTASIIRALIR